jgi:hypothetical protein
MEIFFIFKALVPAAASRMWIRFQTLKIHADCVRKSLKFSTHILKTLVIIIGAIFTS